MEYHDNPADEIPEGLFAIQSLYSRKLGIDTLTPEYEIVYVLLDRDAVPAKALFALSRLESTAFYKTLRRLESNGTLSTSRSPHDGRHKLYHLADGMRDLVLRQHRGYRKLLAQHRQSGEPTHLEMARDHIYRGTQVSHLTAEFQILLYLYLKSGLPNAEMADFVDVSPTKFHASLRLLKSTGIIESVTSPDDRRTRLYFLSEPARSLVSALHIDIFRWIDTHLDTKTLSN